MRLIETAKNARKKLSDWKNGRTPIVDISPITVEIVGEDGKKKLVPVLGVETSLPPREPWTAYNLEEAKEHVLRSRIKIAIVAIPTAIVEFQTTRDVYRGIVEHSEILTQGYRPLESAGMIVSGLALRSLYKRNKMRRAEHREINKHIKAIDKDETLKRKATDLREQDPQIDTLAPFRK